VPEEGYHGEDIVDTMKGFIKEYGDRYLEVSTEDRREAMVEYSLAEKIGAIKATLKEFGVEYDVWFSEQSLHQSGAVANAIERLRQRGYLPQTSGWRRMRYWFAAMECPPILRQI